MTLRDLFPWTKKERKKVTAAEARTYIDGTDVARMQIEFSNEFRSVYPHSLFVCELMAVGPMQTFIGLAIKNGHLRLPEDK